MENTAPILFETESTITLEFYLKNRNHFIRPFQRWSMTIRTGIMAVSSILFIRGGLYIIAIASILCAIFFPIFYFVRFNRDAQQIFAREAETTGHPSLQTTVSLTADNIKVYRPTTGGTVYFSYDAITHMAITSDFYLLFTQAGQVLHICKATITANQQEAALLAFIKEKCANIK